MPLVQWLTLNCTLRHKPQRNSNHIKYNNFLSRTCIWKCWLQKIKMFLNQCVNNETIPKQIFLLPITDSKAPQEKFNHDKKPHESPFSITDPSSKEFSGQVRIKWLLKWGSFKGPKQPKILNWSLWKSVTHIRIWLINQLTSINWSIYPNHPSSLI